MAALPSPTQVAGSQYGMYEAYYRLVDPSNTGSVGAADAAKFLKKSGLSDKVLSMIWDLSDPAGKGYLYKQGFFVALKLVSLAQAGHPVTMDGICKDLPPPKMGDLKVKPIVNNTPAAVPPSAAPIGKGPGGVGDWTIKPPERARYEQLFDSLQPVNGKILGNKVKGVLMESKLPVDTLGVIWDLADMDKDGQLDRHEFMVAMHLVYKALEKHTIPNVLPPELLPPGKRKVSQSNPPPVPPPAVAAVAPMTHLVNVSNAVASQAPPVPPMPTMASSTIPVAPVSAMPLLPALPVTIAPTVPWVVSAEERIKYSELFTQTDIDKDGFVSGAEIKHVFLSSGVPQSVLASIWALCDTKQAGKLNNEQFALAMWLINNKLKGVDPPKALTPEMVPPCMRAKSDAPAEASAVPAPAYSNPELDMIQKDIEELSREKRQLETDITQKEADIKLKNSEVKSLQSELDTLAATLRQLETQKGEAQRRLGDLKTQAWSRIESGVRNTKKGTDKMSTVESELSEVLQSLERETVELENLRAQTAEQEATLKAQEDDLTSKKQELEGLKQEEARLAAQQESFRERLDSLTKNLQDSQLHISQAKAKITLLQEQRSQMTDAISMYDTAINTGDASGVPDWSFNIEPEFRDPEIKRLTMVNGGSPSGEKDGLSSNGPHEVKKEKKTTSLFDDDVPFPVTKASNDPFASDPFSSAFDSKPVDGFSSDPFNSFGKPTPKADPFGSDPFGDSRGGAKTPDMSGKDPFGCDPFSALRPPPEGSVPPPRPESPSPALPPKKSKQPPPRPAPPRPSQGPKLSATTSPAAPTLSPDPSADPFGGGGGGGFADFANFDNKYFTLPLPTSIPPQNQGIVRKGLFSLPRPRGRSKQIPDPLDSSSEISVPVSQRLATSPATSSVTSASETSNRYAAFEFTEDPFRNYRYEDPFNISDPFSDDDNGNKAVTSGALVDPFGMSTSSSSSQDDKFTRPITDDLFDDDFAQSDSIQVGSKTRKDRTTVLDDLSNNNSRSEKVDPFRVLSDQKKAFGDVLSNKTDSKKHSFWSKQSGGNNSLKKKSSLFSHKTQNGAGSTLTEDQQLSWAARESLRLEEERKQRQEQENADLALALELSRQEASGHH